MRFYLALILLWLSSLPAAAQPSPAEITAEVTDNVSTEYVECGAYFSVVYGAFTKAGNIEAAQKYKDTSDKAVQFGLIAAKESRTEEMAEKVTLARFQNDLQAMNKTIDNNYSNMSLLTSNFSDRCVAAMNDSAAVMRRWTEKITEKYQTK